MFNQINIRKKEQTLNFELRGDDLKIINDIKKYIPLTEREDIWSWICYLENEIKDLHGQD